MLARASKVQARGSARTPSTTPSMASQAAIADAFAAANLAGVTELLATSLLTHHGHNVVTCRREL
jgi:hypothetical protein